MRDLRTINLRRLHPEYIHEGVLVTHDGAFVMPSPIDKADMVIICDVKHGWDHVSVSRNNRCPNWPEMDHVKRIFFTDDEVVMQLHVARRDHVNIHPFVLHLWRPQAEAIPLPPKVLV